MQQKQLPPPRCISPTPQSSKSLSSTTTSTPAMPKSPVLIRSWTDGSRSPPSRPLPSHVVATKPIIAKRIRKPNRFVITDVPEDEDQLMGPIGASFLPSPTISPRPSSHPPREKMEPTASYIEPVGQRRIRSGKTEVRGRFTITDLTPDPAPLDTPSIGTAIPCRVPSVSTPHGRLPFRTPPLPRQAKSWESEEVRTAVIENPQLMGTTRSISSTCSSSSATSYGHPPYNLDISMSVPSRVSYRISTSPNTCTHQLAFLQQECADMRAQLEATVMTNACWIETMTQRASTRRCARRTEAPAMSNETLMMSFWETKYHRLERAYAALQQEYRSVEHHRYKIEDTNGMLRARLDQEIIVNEELRSQLEQLTQYTESLIVESEGVNIRNEDNSSVHGTRSEMSSMEMASSSSSMDKPEAEEISEERRVGLPEDGLSESWSEGSPEQASPNRKVSSSVGKQVNEVVVASEMEDNQVENENTRLMRSSERNEVYYQERQDIPSRRYDLGALNRENLRVHNQVAGHDFQHGYASKVATFARFEAPKRVRPSSQKSYG